MLEEVMKMIEKDKLWERLMGFRDDPEEIENLMEEGSESFEIWVKVCECEDRISTKLMRRNGTFDGELGKELHKEFDREIEKDFERMFDYYNKICKIVSLRMFDYGVKHGRGEWQRLFE